jgi:very-short-patch-repair endonuclease
VRSQHSIVDRAGREIARADFLVGERVVVEFDGRAKYGMDGRRPEHDLWAEKRREDRIRELGYIVVRVVWADLDRPDEVVARVLAALRQAETMA